jgi:hypothetical protein
MKYYSEEQIKKLLEKQLQMLDNDASSVFTRKTVESFISIELPQAILIEQDGQIFKNTSLSLEKVVSELPKREDTIVHKEHSKRAGALGDWIPEPEAMKLLHKKKTALYLLRMTGKIIVTENTRPIFYSYKSIVSYLDSMSSNNK